MGIRRVGQFKVEGFNDPQLRSQNIKSGVRIMDVDGTSTAKDYTSDATVAAADLLSGKTAYGSAGTKVTGAMANRSGTGYVTPTSVATSGTTVYMRFPPGAYLTGSSGTNGASVEVSASDPNLNAGAIRAGYSIFGVAGDAWVVWTGEVDSDDGAVLNGYRYWAYGSKRTGTMRNCSADNWNMPAIETSAGENWLHFRAPKGYYNGDSWVSVNNSNFWSGNIRSGINMFGLGGTMPVRFYASGVTYVNANSLNFDTTPAYGNTYPTNYMTVGSIGFNPTTVCILRRDRGYYTWSQSGGISLETNGYNYDIMTNGGATKYKLSGNAYMNSSGFRLPVGAQNMDMEWFAFA